MTADAVIDAAGVYAGTFAVGAISSVIPIVSIEVFLVGLVVTRGPGGAVALIVLAALGQVLGKLPIYITARGAAALPCRQRRWVERIRAWVARRGQHPTLVLAASAVLGIPPFSLISTAAGALAIPPRTFCTVIAAGRALRFAILIAVTAAFVQS